MEVQRPIGTGVCLPPSFRPLEFGFPYLGGEPGHGALRRHTRALYGFVKSLSSFRGLLTLYFVLSDSW
jgi:hypothetical protein